MRIVKDVLGGAISKIRGLVHLKENIIYVVSNTASVIGSVYYLSRGGA